MTKIFPKVIIKITNLKNKFNKEKNAKNWSSYKQQRSFCSNLLKEAKIIGMFMLIKITGVAVATLVLL